MNLHSVVCCSNSFSLYAMTASFPKAIALSAILHTEQSINYCDSTLLHITMREQCVLYWDIKRYHIGLMLKQKAFELLSPTDVKLSLVSDD